MERVLSQNTLKESPKKDSDWFCLDYMPIPKLITMGREKNGVNWLTQHAYSLPSEQRLSLSHQINKWTPHGKKDSKPKECWAKTTNTLYKERQMLGIIFINDNFVDILDK
jgi:hypothetical protein